jgi:hypothetical protein
MPLCRVEEERRMFGKGKTFLFLVLFLLTSCVAAENEEQAAERILPRVLDLVPVPGTQLVSCETLPSTSRPRLELMACVKGSIADESKLQMAYLTAIRESGWQFLRAEANVFIFGKECRELGLAVFPLPEDPGPSKWRDIVYAFMVIDKKDCK